MIDNFSDWLAVWPVVWFRHLNIAKPRVRVIRWIYWLKIIDSSKGDLHQHCLVPQVQSLSTGFFSAVFFVTVCLSAQNRLESNHKLETNITIITHKNPLINLQTIVENNALLLTPTKFNSKLVKKLNGIDNVYHWKTVNQLQSKTLLHSNLFFNLVKLPW